VKQNIVAFVAGLLFAVGLVVGGMTQPAKVVGFLDFFGNWDPSLIFVMGGAVGIHFVLFRLILKRSSPLLAQSFQVPTRKDMTPQLIGGAALFGIGWGLGGFCPGPGIVAAPAGSAEALTFVASMTAGMFLYKWVESLRSKKTAEEQPGQSQPEVSRT
jgi:uncharacterized membrane protein YedE/YeeE